MRSSQVARIGMAMQRSKETLDKASLVLAWKKDVKSLDNKAYHVCDVYYELLVFLAKSTDRVDST